MSAYYEPAAGFLRGLPPRLPFSRAAAALAFVLALPPRRPSATAAGFFRVMCQLSPSSTRQACCTSFTKSLGIWNRSSHDSQVVTKPSVLVCPSAAGIRFNPKPQWGQSAEMVNDFAAVSVAVSIASPMPRTIPSRLGYVKC